jgi:hypothetical protein
MENSGTCARTSAGVVMGRRYTQGHVVRRVQA